MDDSLRESKVQEVQLIPVGEGKFFINAYKHGGMPDIHVELKKDGLYFTDGKQAFLAKKILE